MEAKNTRYTVPFYSLVDVEVDASSPEEALRIAETMTDREYEASNSAMFSRNILLYERTPYVYRDGEKVYEREG